VPVPKALEGTMPGLWEQPLLHISLQSVSKDRQVCPSKRRPDGGGNGEGGGRGLGRLYGTALPLRDDVVTDAPVTSPWETATPLRRDAPVLNHAFTESTNVGASLRRARPDELAKTG